jgi:hypothetical protein
MPSQAADSVTNPAEQLSQLHLDGDTSTINKTALRKKATGDKV